MKSKLGTEELIRQASNVLPGSGLVQELGVRLTTYERALTLARDAAVAGEDLMYVVSIIDAAIAPHIEKDNMT